MRFEGRARVSARIDLAPLIDVVFLLLIFFLLTSSFVSRRALELDLPGSTTAVSVPNAPVVVSVLADGGIRIDGDAVAEAALAAAVAERIADDPLQQIAVAADRRVSAQRLITVLDSVRAGGAQSVSLITETEKVP